MKKRIVSILAIFAFLMCSLCTLALAADEPRLVDNADLLTDYEEEELIALLDEISERQEFDVVIVTEESLGGTSPMVYADDYFDYNVYGYGENRDGALLLLAMDERDWYISTHGYGITAITDAGREEMADEFVPYLSDGEYCEGFKTFALLCDEFVTDARERETDADATPYPSDVPNYYDSYYGGYTVFDELEFIHYFWVILAGFIVALIVVGCMKRKLKSVRRQPGASSYVRPDSMVLTAQNDIFLYSHVSRVPRPKDTGSGGSSTHTSSSGATHGGGGGKF